MSKAGRKCKYELNVQPYLKEIDQWLNAGATEKQCAEALRVAYSTFNDYKNKFKELDDLCRKPRVALCMRLQGALVKSALGYEYVEKKVYTKNEDGKKVEYTEITKKYQPPNVTAIFGAQRKFESKEERIRYDYQAQQIELKKQELELKKKLAAKDIWE